MNITLTQKEVDQITKHFSKWKKRGFVDEMRIVEIRENIEDRKLDLATILIVIELKGEEFTIVPPKGYTLTEVTIINLSKMRFELWLKREK